MFQLFLCYMWQDIRWGALSEGGREGEPGHIITHQIIPFPSVAAGQVIVIVRGSTVQVLASYIFTVVVMLMLVVVMMMMVMVMVLTV